MSAPSARADAEVRLAAEVGAGADAAYGGLTAAAVARIVRAKHVFPEMFTPAGSADARFNGILPGGTFIGFPLAADGKTIGYVETYTNAPPGFSFSAQIEQEVAAIASAAAALFASGEEAPSPRGTILVVDDDIGTRMTLRKILERAGFHVLDASDGVRACEAALRDRPDLVLMDWNMPVMDGRTAVERLKANPATRTTPVLMLSSISGTDDKVSALRAGVQDFLTKPFNERELIARVEQHLEWRKLLGAQSSGENLSQPLERAAVPVPAVFATDGDVWSRAAQAEQVGHYHEALSLFVLEAQRSEEAKHYPRAAIAYRSASLAAARLRERERSDALMRSAGKMYLLWAEQAADAKSIQEAYLSSARCFLASGNLQTAKKSLDLANSLESVMSDDHSSLLHEQP